MKKLFQSRARRVGTHRRGTFMTALSVLLLLAQYASGIFLMAQPVHATAGLTPLHLSAQNSRYFEDANGRLVYLTGSHTWANGSDNGDGYPPPAFDYNAYLDYLQAHGHNFMRYWRWEQTRWSNETADDNYWFGMQPYMRTTGQGNALDGLGKFDLTQWNDAYFQQLRQRVSQANDRGIYVSVMLFNGWSVSCKGTAGTSQYWCANQPFKGHPLNANNNINGINGDTNGDGNGDETQTLANPQIVALDDAYIKKVSDTIGDLPNVMYEVSNESNGSTANRDWQYHIIDTLHAYENGKYQNANGTPYHHPIGFSMQFPNANLTSMLNSNAEWMAYGGDINNPGVNTSGKVQFGDTDHQCGSCGGSADWAWKDFLRGLNPLQMDVYDGVAFGSGAYAIGNKLNDPTWQNTRFNMGKTLEYANRLNLAKAVPSTTLCSTQFCLANPTNGSAQFITYNPSGGSFTVNLAGITGTLTAEWYNPATLASTPVSTPVNGGGTTSFNAPFSGPSVLFLTQVVAPTVTVSGVASGSTVRGTVNLGANVTNGSAVASVGFAANGTAIATTTSPYSTTWDTTTVADGGYQIVATAYDASGKSLAVSPAVAVTVNNYVPTPPTLTITAPASGATLGGATNTVSADASDNEGIQDVTFYLDNASTGTSTTLATDTAAPYQANLDTSALANGNYTLRVVARDTHLTPTTQTEPGAVFNPDGTPPNVSVTSPANNALVSGAATLAATASDQSGIADVAFYLDGAQVADVTAGAPQYTFAWDTTAAAEGAHQIYAVATDTAGNSAQSATTTVNVHNQAPTVSLMNAAGTVSGTVPLGASASDAYGIASVKYYYGSTLIGTGAASSPYGLSWNTAAVANGQYTLTAVATNTAGISATSAPVTVTVNNQVASVPGLLAAYGFNTSATGLNDASGLANTLTCGTACPAFTASGHSGGAYDFSGSNNYLVVPSSASFNLTSGMTIEYWMKESAWTKTWETIMSKGNNTYSVGRYGNNALADFSTSGLLSGNITSWDNKSVSNPANGAWHHVASTWDGSTKKIYVDGVLELTYAWNRALLTNTQNLTIGANAQNMASEYGGQLDDVRIYSRALSASEITTDMNTPVN
ncbi:MAG TPA: Ig-like domain-containing protein [Candidatus Saccharimonadales bacterium]|nr:Ig-like domain-containing protein [Candidatus Saccharimonadales bacterium]